MLETLFERFDSLLVLDTETTGFSPRRDAPSTGMSCTSTQSGTSTAMTSGRRRNPKRRGSGVS